MLTIVAIFLVCCIGCRRGSSTDFATTHNAEAYFKSLEASHGYEVIGCSHSSGCNSPRSSQGFCITIKGDKSLYNTLMHEYRSHVRNELQKSGVTIYSEGITSGQISGFEFCYHGSGVSGVVIVRSVIDINKNIDIDVFIYEHGS